MTHRIPWWEPQLTGGETGRIAAVLASNYLNEGDVTSEFEREVAALVGARHGIATTSGTTALFLALAALGVGRGDEVIVPDVTFIATANAVRLTGALPVLVDADPRTLNIDVMAMERAVTDRTRAIVPVHVSGRGVDMAALLAIAEDRHLPVVEDAAEALLSGKGGRNYGTLGAAGCFSFSPNKTITTGQGGMVVTNDDALVDRLRALKDQGRPVRGTGGNDIHSTLGYNFKLTNLQAAVGLAQVRALPARVAHLQNLYRAYCDRLAGVPQVRVLPFDVDGGESPQWVDAIADDRDALVAHLLRQDIHCRPFWFPLHTQQPDRQPDAGFPVSSELTRSALWLPSALQLGEADVRLVCDEIERFYRHRR